MPFSEKVSCPLSQPFKLRQHLRWSFPNSVDAYPSLCSHPVINECISRLQVVLLDQKLVMDESKKVSAWLEDQRGLVGGSKITVTGFVRVQVGEGVEKEEKDFAKEVAAAQSSKSK